MKYSRLGVIVTLFLLPWFSLCRNVHRAPDPKTQKIVTQWVNRDNSKQNTLISPYLEQHPLFHVFNEQYFRDKHLPTSAITYRNNPTKTVSGARLQLLIEHLLQEIHAKKKKYTHFEILQKKDFSRRKECGLIVLKFKDYPFVVKLFSETPESFVKHSGKGLEQEYFFYMGGGVNRHLTGFTRIKNLEAIQKKIAADPYWSQLVETPRKWSWLPKKTLWFSIHGYNFDSAKVLTTKIPSVYAVIADAIETEKQLSLRKKEDTELALSLYNFLESAIDPHINNFMIEKDTHKLVIIDTEHFPTLIGIQEHMPSHNYTHWYTSLIKKCRDDMILFTKKDRDKRADKKAHPLFTYNA